VLLVRRRSSNAERKFKLSSPPMEPAAAGASAGAGSVVVRSFVNFSRQQTGDRYISLLNFALPQRNFSKALALEIRPKVDDGQRVRGGAHTVDITMLILFRRLLASSRLSLLMALSLVSEVKVCAPRLRLRLLRLLATKHPSLLRVLQIGRRRLH